MKLSDFDYNLPQELIAQYPSEVRGDDRLLVVERAQRKFEEKKFGGIYGYLEAGDVLVLNDTRVMPSRLFGRRKTGGKVEIFVVDRTKRPVEALVRPAARLKLGEEIELECGDRAVIGERTGLGRLVEFSRDIDEIIGKSGHMPLPPYISRQDEESDRYRYQTVYARRDGALAAPTAGLHFTGEMLKMLEAKGVVTAYITLHVSYGTFAPVKSEDFTSHRMHSEYYRVAADEILKIKRARAARKKVVACGTTSVRVLEACADFIINFIPNAVAYGETYDDHIDGCTNIFIYPGYEFRIVDALITNFHLPKSTLVLLTAAFAGRELLFDAYRYAVDKKFRFFSYGDAMLIV